MVVNLYTDLEPCSLGIGDPFDKDVSAVEHDMLKESPLCVRSLPPMFAYVLTYVIKYSLFCVRSLPPYGACFIQVIWPNLSLLPRKCCYRKLSRAGCKHNINKMLIKLNKQRNYI